MSEEVRVGQQWRLLRTENDRLRKRLGEVGTIYNIFYIGVGIQVRFPGDGHVWTMGLHTFLEDFEKEPQ